MTIIYVPNLEPSCLGNWRLVIGAYLVFEIWLLVIPVRRHDRKLRF